MELAKAAELALKCSGKLTLDTLQDLSNDDYASLIDAAWVEWEAFGAHPNSGSVINQYLATQTDSLAASSTAESVYHALKLLSDKLRPFQSPCRGLEPEGNVEQVRANLYAKHRMYHKAGKECYLKWMYINNTIYELSSLDERRVGYYKSYNAETVINGVLTSETVNGNTRVSWVDVSQDESCDKFMLPKASYEASNNLYQQAVLMGYHRCAGSKIRKSAFYYVKKKLGYSGDAEDLKYHKLGAKVQVSNIRAAVAWSYVLFSIVLSILSGALNWAGRTHIYERILDVFQLAALLLVSVFGLVKLTSEDESAIRHTLMGEYILTTAAHIKRYLGVSSERDMLMLYAKVKARRSIFSHDNNWLVNFGRMEGHIDVNEPMAMEDAISAGAITIGSYIVTPSGMLASLKRKGDIMHVQKVDMDKVWWLDTLNMKVG